MIQRLNALAEWKQETAGIEPTPYYPRRIYTTKCTRCGHRGKESDVYHNCTSCNAKESMRF